MKSTSTHETNSGDSAVAERVILVRQESGRTSSQLGHFEEVTLLAEAAGAEVAGVLLSKRAIPSASTFIGKGKAEELRALARAVNATLVIVDHAITPVQERNIELAVSCRVIDRTRLILDIFARRARSREGKLQVELAQLRHLSTRLVRGWTHLERQKGGIGLRGPGETQLETDRRLIGKRVKTLVKRLDKVSTQRELRRHVRKKVPIATVALVGYTNAGKSSLFNRLSGAGALVQNALFSTLDTTMRRLELPDYGSIILSDTVGFIRELPHGLVTAFHATLEEVSSASLLLHVIDISSEEGDDRVRDVERVLEEIGAADIPRISVYNKIDQVDEHDWVCSVNSEDVKKIWVSAKTGAGVDDLLAVLSQFFRKDLVSAQVCLPAFAGRLRSSIYVRLGVKNERVLNTGESLLDIELNSSDIGWLDANKEFKDEYWRKKPSVPSMVLR